MEKLLILTCGKIVLLVVNVICVDFAGLTLRRKLDNKEDLHKIAYTSIDI
jgi:hypothetical protein